MRMLGLGLLLIVILPGWAAALPGPELNALPDEGVVWYCGQVGERTEHYEPTQPPTPPPPPPYTWKNVSVSLDPDACLKPLTDACANTVGSSCCADVPDLCDVSGLTGQGSFQVGHTLPTGGGVCVTVSKDDVAGASVRTANCWDP